ncbi:unnamed protein product [Laminaria digitata]
MSGSGCEHEHGKVKVDDDSDEDEDIFAYANGQSGVQLGTVVPLEGSQDRVLFKNVDWHDWDGGKAGGWPVWLNPRDLPASQDMRCGECTHPLAFLVQLYCPLDHEDDAFHRCLYVFCCPKASCSKNSSVKALRCQLPRDNAFYPYEPDDNVPAAASAGSEEEASVLAKRQAGADPAAWGVNVCCVCGQLAKSACSKCRTARYCGREHQAEHWKKGGHKKSCSVNASAPSSENTLSTAQVPGSGKTEAKGDVRAPQQRIKASVFREFEVAVRPEPPPPPVAPDGRTAEDTLVGKMGLGDGGDGDSNAEDGEDDDSKLSQAELDKVAGVHGVKDNVTLKFLTRTQANPQVVRYDETGGGPLWSSSNGLPGKSDVPPCPRCGQARKFEFQVMPHLLHHLGVDENATALDAKVVAARRELGAAPLTTGECMDWGTLAIYTCPDSCPSSVRGVAESLGSGGDGGETQGAPAACYVQEFAWRQPPP